MNNEIKFHGNNSIFATRLRQLMSDRKITQQQLADFVGTTRQAVSQYMDGSVQPNIEKLYKISNYFGIYSDYLLGLTDVKFLAIDDIAINKKIGLSETVIEFLTMCNNEDETNNRKLLNTINFLLENEALEFNETENKTTLKKISEYFEFDLNKRVTPRRFDGENWIEISLDTLKESLPEDLQGKNLPELLEGIMLNNISDYLKADKKTYQANKI